jgi:hypothetical protein
MKSLYVTMSWMSRLADVKIFSVILLKNRYVMVRLEVSELQIAVSQRRRDIVANALLSGCGVFLPTSFDTTRCSISMCDAFVDEYISRASESGGAEQFGRLGCKLRPSRRIKMQSLYTSSRVSHGMGCLMHITACWIEAATAQ